MDVFVEKIVTKKKNAVDYIFIVGMVALGVVVSVAAIIFLGQIAVPLIVAAGFGVYYLITSRSVEFEYSVVNGELDIDKITAKRRRKNIFSASCKEFEVVAPGASEHFTPDVKSIKKRIEAVSSIQSPDVYFIIVSTEREKVLVFFQPDKRMLANFKSMIPKKVFE